MAGVSKIKEEELLSLIEKGLPIQSIADTMGVHKTSIEARLNKLEKTWDKKKGGNPRGLTDEQEIAMVARYVDGEGATSLGKYYEVAKKTIYNILNRRGVGTRTVEARRTPSKHPPRLSERDAIIKGLYELNKNIPELAAQVGVHENTIRYSLKKQGIFVTGDATLEVRQRQRSRVDNKKSANRDENLRHDAFDFPTADACYWAGFILADGCISRVIGKTPRIVIRLNAKDSDHLHTFLSWVQSNNTVTVGKVTTFDKVRDYAVCQVSSKPMASRLEEWGITEGKEGRWVNPILAQSVDFWRGLVDGDGSIKRRGDGIYLSGSLAVVNAWAEYCDAVLGDLGTVSIRIQPQHGGCYVGRVRRTDHSKAICQLLYTGANTCLKRKLERAMANKKPSGQ